MSLKPETFFALISAKKRRLEFTVHAISRAERRFMDKGICERELATVLPFFVEEQASEIQGERVFDVYFLQKDEKYHRYVIVINEVLRVITMMRISRDLQRRWSMHGKSRL